MRTVFIILLVTLGLIIFGCFLGLWWHNIDNVLTPRQQINTYGPYILIWAICFGLARYLDETK